MSLRTLAAFLSGATLLLAQDPEAALVRTADQIAHYQRVERELRAAPAPADPQRAAARARAIELLHDYWSRAEFGENTDFPGRRQPYFIDGKGRRCAVAYLLDGTGHGALTERVAATANFAWVAELVGDRELCQWLDAHGLSASEAARIQDPGRGGREWPPPPPRSQPVDPVLTPRGGGRGGTGVPADYAPPSATPTRGAVPSAAPVANAGGAQPIAPGAARGTALAELAAETWLPWFDLQVDRWLPARTAPAATTQSTGVDTLRAEVAAKLAVAITDTDANVRAAAVWGLGQLGAAPAVLRPALLDPAYDVRCSAIAALAATDTAASVHLLLQLADDPQTRPLRPLVFAALACMRRADTVVRTMAVPAIAATDDPELLGAVAAFARLRGNAELTAAALPRLGDATPVSLRAQVAGAFGGAVDLAAVAALTKAVSSRGPAARAAAAAALGRSGHELALPALLTAYEHEHDVAVRSELLLAIGEHGGLAARAFLLEQAASGPKILRGTAALALGVFARDRDDEGVRAAVRAGLAAERNRSATGHWLLALGLLRDVASRQLVEDGYRDGDSLARAAAVWALALFEDPSQLPRLCEILRTDHCPLVRRTAATVLGRSGDVRAVAMLAASADGQGAVDVQQTIALALGGSGDRAAAPHLVRLSTAGTAPVRAAALRGLARLVSSDASPRFARLGFQVDRRSLPPTVQWLAGLDR